MSMQTFELRDEYIQLNQLLNSLAWVESGAMAKLVITEGLVTVNGNTEHRKRNKIQKGFIVEFNNQSIKIV